jgi:hypothetical protein
MGDAGGISFGRRHELLGELPQRPLLLQAIAPHVSLLLNRPSPHPSTRWLVGAIQNPHQPRPIRGRLLRLEQLSEPAQKCAQPAIHPARGNSDGVDTDEGRRNELTFAPSAAPPTLAHNWPGMNSPRSPFRDGTPGSRTANRCAGPYGSRQIPAPAWEPFS